MPDLLQDRKPQTSKHLQRLQKSSEESRYSPPFYFLYSNISVSPEDAIPHPGDRGTFFPAICQFYEKLKMAFK